MALRGHLLGFYMTDNTLHLVNRILHIGKSEYTGMEYTKDSLDNIVSSWKTSKSPLYGTTQSTMDYGIDLSEVASEIVDMYVDDEGLVIVQKLLDTPSGKLMKYIIDPDLELSYKVSPVIKFDNQNNIELQMVQYLGV